MSQCGKMWYSVVECGTEYCSVLYALLCVALHCEGGPSHSTGKSLLVVPRSVPKCPTKYHTSNTHFYQVWTKSKSQCQFWFMVGWNHVLKVNSWLVSVDWGHHIITFGFYIVAWLQLKHFYFHWNTFTGKFTFTLIHQYHHIWFIRCGSRLQLNPTFPNKLSPREVHWAAPLRSSSLKSLFHNNIVLWGEARLNICCKDFEMWHTRPNFMIF